MSFSLTISSKFLCSPLKNVKVSQWKGPSEVLSREGSRISLQAQSGPEGHQRGYHKEICFSPVMRTYFKQLTSLQLWSPKLWPNSRGANYNPPKFSHNFIWLCLCYSITLHYRLAFITRAYTKEFHDQKESFRDHLVPWFADCSREVLHRPCQHRHSNVNILKNSLIQFMKTSAWSSSCLLSACICAGSSNRANDEKRL